MKDRVTRIAAAIGIVLVALALAFAIVVGALAFFAGKPYEACWVPTYNGIPTTVVDGQPVVICQTVWRVSFD